MRSSTNRNLAVPEEPEAIAEPRPRRSTPWGRVGVRGMKIYKLCLVCADYFQGELDGEYTCPQCRRDAPAPLHRLASLNSLGRGVTIAEETRAA